MLSPFYFLVPGNISIQLIKIGFLSLHFVFVFVFGMSFTPWRIWYFYLGVK